MRIGLIVAALLAGFLCGARPSAADQVLLSDGSVLMGTVLTLADGNIHLDTAFGGELAVPWEHVTGISTETALVVQLQSGEKVAGVLNATDGQQFVHAAEGGEVSVILAEVVGIGPEGQEPAPPETAPADVEASPAPKDLWKGRAELGVNGQTGNKDRIDVRGGIDLNRNTDMRRLNLYLKGQYAETNDLRSANEVMGGARLEVDFSKRTYVFAKIDLEYDEFEDLDLRATLTTGMGHFFIEREKLELKGWIGAGYEYEDFDKVEGPAIPDTANFEAALREAIRLALVQRFEDIEDDETQSDIVAEAGYAFRWDLKQNFRFKHGLTYYPKVSDSFMEFRIAADTALEFPLGKDPDWTLRTGIRHEYDSSPQEGVDTLDTTYYLNLGYNF